MSDKPPPPLSFIRACRMFHADIDRTHPTIEGMATFALGGVSKSERESLAEYLDRLLSGDYTSEELKDLWNNSGADVFIPDVKNLIALFTAMRQQLHVSPSTKQPS
jgi:hypothetical protein